MTRVLNIRIEIPGAAHKNMNLIVEDATIEDAEEITAELDGLLRQGIRELKFNGHKIRLG